MKTCSECAKWYRDRETISIGKCKATSLLWDCTEWGDDFSRTLKDECADVKMFCQDGSDYKASLYTRPDHGCLSYEVNEMS